MNKNIFPSIVWILILLKKYKKTALIFCFSFVYIYGDSSFAEKIIIITGEITEYKQKTFSVHGTDFFAFYDASILKITSDKYKDQEIMILHHTAPAPDERKKIDASWKRKGTNITFSISSSTLEKALKKRSHKNKPGRIYFSQIKDKGISE